MKNRHRGVIENRALVIILAIIFFLLIAVFVLYLLVSRRGSSPEVNVADAPATSSPAVVPTETPTPTPAYDQAVTDEQNTEEPKEPTPTPEDETNGFMVAIDAGHQKYGNSDTEPIGPGSSTKKAKVADGATGCSTGVPEYQLNLDVAKKLKKELKRRGYKVYMIRTKNDVDISNVERAQAANDSGADICIRLHADGIDDSGVRGASALYHTPDNPYIPELSKKSKKLSKCVLDAYCEATGFNNRGLSERDDLTGTNWSEIPVTLIEMGFMSNASEDETMQDADFQYTMAEGIADGIDAYFGL